MTVSLEQCQELSRLVRYYIVESTTRAGSGHVTSSLSAVELMTTLMFGGFFKYDVAHHDNPANDRLIFSKGHAAPLLYALWAAAGVLDISDLDRLRKFGSSLEGHPSVRFPYAEAATGSLGQGLSIGFGMALAAKYVLQLPYRTFVLLGDSELAEGSNWEAMALATHYKLCNLIGIVDINRLGQRGPTMLGHNVSAYRRRVESFGWRALVVDGHDVAGLAKAYRQACASSDRPTMILAKTIKGKGVSFLENKEGWHGKVLDHAQSAMARHELGEAPSITGSIAKPEKHVVRLRKVQPLGIEPYASGELIATRKAYGDALIELMRSYPTMVVLDAEVSNSTGVEAFKKVYPDRFYEMFIAEQNMIGAAVGMARRGLIPFVSTFAAFLTRAFDQIRMAQYSHVNIKIVGSHAGVSIGQDGPSQMGLEDIAMFRTIEQCVVLYPSDAVSTRALIAQAARHHGMVYVRTTRQETPIIYPASQTFPIGRSKVVRISDRDVATVVAAGITVHEALAAYDILEKRGIRIRVIDAYSIKPIDSATLRRAAQQTKHIITVEDHVPAGGLGEAVCAALAHVPTPITTLAVRKTPRSGRPEELLAYEEIDRTAIVNAILQLT